MSTSRFAAAIASSSSSSCEIPVEKVKKVRFYSGDSGQDSTVEKVNIEKKAEEVEKKVEEAEKKDKTLSELEEEFKQYEGYGVWSGLWQYGFKWGFNQMTDDDW